MKRMLLVSRSLLLFDASVQFVPVPSLRYRRDGSDESAFSRLPMKASISPSLSMSTMVTARPRASGSSRPVPVTRLSVPLLLMNTRFALLFPEVSMRSSSPSPSRSVKTEPWLSNSPMMSSTSAKLPGPFQSTRVSARSAWLLFQMSTPAPPRSSVVAAPNDGLAPPSSRFTTVGTSVAVNPLQLA